MEGKSLTFNELMVLGAIISGHLNPYNLETWNKSPDFFRGLARVTASILKEGDDFKEEYQEQFEFWEKGKDIDAFRQKIQETIRLLQERRLLEPVQ